MISFSIKKLAYVEPFVGRKLVAEYEAIWAISVIKIKVIGTLLAA